MAQLSSADIQEVQSIAAQALIGEDVATVEAVAGVDLGDAKDFFCNN